mmetsp:Transcript_19062/g.24628  ORF Transcript_19062/g.24628 Transcript_19062/m.24628 type:complete len:82 (+) Transcript_19062:1777-2022(+)
MIFFTKLEDKLDNICRFNLKSHVSSLFLLLLRFDSIYPRFFSIFTFVSSTIDLKSQIITGSVLRLVSVDHQLLLMQYVMIK